MSLSPSVELPELPGTFLGRKAGQVAIKNFDHTLCSFV